MTVLCLIRVVLVVLGRMIIQNTNLFDYLFEDEYFVDILYIFVNGKPWAIMVPA